MNSGTDLDFYVKYVIPFLSGFGIVALAWNIINLIITRIGYLKLNLECQFKCTHDEKFIICKTSVDNTAWRKIELAKSCLVIVHDHISHISEALGLAVDAINQKSGINSKPETISDHLDLIFDYCEDNGHLLESDTCIVRTLPYYYTDQARLGSLEHLQTAHIQSVTHDGRYSIYFIVVGTRWYRKPWYKKPDYSHLRFVHDEIIIAAEDSQHLP
jgi:hypothetical protein